MKRTLEDRNTTTTTTTTISNSNNNNNNNSSSERRKRRRTAVAPSASSSTASSSSSHLHISELLPSPSLYDAIQTLRDDDLPSKNQLLHYIEQVENAISNLSARVEEYNFNHHNNNHSDHHHVINNSNNNNNNNNRKDEFNNSNDDQLIRNKNKIQQIYFENRKKCQEAYSQFDSLLPDSMLHSSASPASSYSLYSSDATLLEPLKHVGNYSEIPIVKNCIQQFDAISSELERNILTEWRMTHRRNVQLGREHRERMQKWKDDHEKTKKRRKRGAQSKEDEEREELEQYTSLTAVCPPMLTPREKELEVLTRNGYVSPDTLRRQLDEQRKYECAWTDEERKIFMDKFAEFPKNCKKIATFLPNKTTYDCVNYYYNHKLTPDFIELKKRLKKKRKYMKRVYDEGPGTRNRANHRPPESPVVDDVETGRPRRSAATQSKTKEEWSEVEAKKYITLLKEHGTKFSLIALAMKTKNAIQCQKYFTNNKSDLSIYLPKPKTAEKPATTSNKSNQQAAQQPQRITEVTTSPSTVEAESTLLAPPVSSKESDEDRALTKTKKQVSIWTNYERDTFLQLLLDFGKDWKKIAEQLPSKNENQIKNFYQNYKVKLGIAAPPGIRKPKRKKRYILIEPPASLCKLADIAQQVNNIGMDSVYNLQSLLCDEPAVSFEMRHASATPPPPPSLSTIAPVQTKNTSEDDSNFVNLLAFVSDQNVPVTNQQAQPQQQITPDTNTTKKKATNNNIKKKSGPGSGRGRKPLDYPKPVVSQPHQQTNNFFLNNQAIYGMPTSNGNTGTINNENSIASGNEAGKATRKKTKKNTPPKTVPQAAQSWLFPLISPRSEVAEVGPFLLPATPPPDLVSNEHLTHNALSRYLPNPVVNAISSSPPNNLPPIHAFSSVLSQLKLSDVTHGNPPSSSNNSATFEKDKGDKRNLIDQLIRNRGNDRPNVHAGTQPTSVHELDGGKVPDYVSYYPLPPQNIFSSVVNNQPAISQPGTYFGTPLPSTASSSEPQQGSQPLHTYSAFHPVLPLPVGDNATKANVSTK